MPSRDLRTIGALLAVVAAVGLYSVIGRAQTSGAVPSPCDMTTSGGFVLTDNGQEANFGAHGGCKKGEFWGHVNYVDHTTNYHVDSVQITGYLTPYPGSNVRDICGLATTNAAEPQPVAFHLRLVDNGEPGDGDEFGIRLSNGYLVTTRLLNGGLGGGGNIQIHDPNPSTAGPNPSPDPSTMCSVSEPIRIENEN